MRTNGLLDEVSAAAWDFAWLRRALEPASDYGDRAFEACVPFAPGEEAQAQARAQRIARIAVALDGKLDAVRDALRNAPDAAGALARASMGDTLSDAHFLELLRWFDTLTRVDALTAGCDDLPRLVDGAVRTAASAIERGRAGKFGFYLDDAFDVRLSKARAAAEAAQAEYDSARSRTVAALSTVLKRDDLTAEFIIMRDELVAPLPAGVRILREAPTYVLCTIDADDATLHALQRRDAAQADVAQAEMAVRATLTSVIRDRVAALDAAARRCGELDVLVAAARFSNAYGCQPATIVEGARVEFHDGRYLPLAELLEREGRPFTPLELHLHDTVVLTGPNMGGKSVCLRTAGFIAILAQYGVPVPAREARIGLFDECNWLGIGADGDGGAGSLLSSFAREVVRLREVLARDARRSFIAIDEFARTTTPYEGKALLVALLHRLKARGVCGIVATHLFGIARAAQVRHYGVRGLRNVPERSAQNDLGEALASLAASMDYTVAEVTGSRERSSDAIALAALLGIDDDLIHDAYAALSET